MVFIKFPVVELHTESEYRYQVTDLSIKFIDVVPDPASSKYYLIQCYGYQLK